MEKIKREAFRQYTDASVTSTLVLTRKTEITRDQQKQLDKALDAMMKVVTMRLVPHITTLAVGQLANVYERVVDHFVHDSEEGDWKVKLKLEVVAHVRISRADLKQAIQVAFLGELPAIVQRHLGSLEDSDGTASLYSLKDRLDGSVDIDSRGGMSDYELPRSARLGKPRRLS